MKHSTTMKGLFISLFSILLLSSTSCCNKGGEKSSCPYSNSEKVSQAATITKAEVLEAQKVWGEGIIKIGEAFTNKEDYRQVAKDHINQLYNYAEGTVLFKPTLASEKQFRLDFDGALSYFVAGDENYPEDHGFAIKPWKSVRWEVADIKLLGDVALALGNYYFMPLNGDKEVKAEFTFAYVKDKDGKLRIIMHGSHLPYTPKAH